jgi:5-methylcytosine-specific restriction endonuclease McrA
MCGASASDGAVLHIDHITPVSHDGLTVPENLQTLCQSCNLGKSNRFVG